MAGTNRRGRTRTSQVLYAYVLWRPHTTVGYGSEASQPTCKYGGTPLQHPSHPVFVPAIGPSRGHRAGTDIYHPTSVLHGILVRHQSRGDRLPLLWRKWSDSSLPLRFAGIPPSSALDPLGCVKLCIWEWDPDVTPLPPPLDGDKSPMAKARRQLLTLRDDKEH